MPSILRCQVRLAPLLILLWLGTVSRGLAQEPTAPAAPEPGYLDKYAEQMLNVPVGEIKEKPGLQLFTRDRFEAGNVGWILTGAAACLVLLAPGWVILYGGLLGRRDLTPLGSNYLLLVAILSVVWVLWGYSLTFARNTKSRDVRPEEIEAPDRTDLPGNLFIGGLEHVALMGIESEVGTVAPRYPLRRPRDPIPHALFVMYQMAFYLSVPAPLMIALAARLKFGGWVGFAVLWSTLVYAPITYWLWGGGWHTGALDTAGGIAAHVAVGFSALAAGLALPKADPQEPVGPVSGWLVLAALLLWVGSMIWSGTRTLAADGYGANAFLTTHLAGCAGLIGWTLLARWRHQAVSVADYCLGPLTGLVAIASGSSYVGPQSAIVIGLLGGMAGFVAYQALRRASVRAPVWNVFALQGVPAALGALLTAVFATPGVGGFTREGSPVLGLLSGSFAPLMTQSLALGSAAALAILGSLVALLVVRSLGGMQRAEPIAEPAKVPARAGNELATDVPAAS